MSLQFILTLGVAALTVGLGSLLWPKLTARVRPKPLTEIRNVVMQTPMGKQAATILGVSDEGAVTPINVSSVASSLVSGVVSAVGQKAQETVTRQAVQQLINQVDQLPADQKQQIQEALCKP
ncbi:hypothetical protein HY950_00015 [Candidatus Gottesmanbacteria bacterium]|nr:hypothetical protein [Candidatus Gottesmanbacteria bacterium]